MIHHLYRVAAVCAVAALLGATGCQTSGLIGAVTPDYESLSGNPRDCTSGIPFRLSRPEFLIQPKKKEDGSIESWQVLVNHVTDERAVFWVNVDPGFLHSSTEFKLTFGDPVTNKTFAPGSLVSVTHKVSDESKGVVDLIAEFAALGLSLYTLAEADSAAEYATGGALTAMAIARDPGRDFVFSDSQDMQGALETIQGVGGDLQGLGFSDDVAGGFASPWMREAIQLETRGAERPMSPMGGAEPDPSHLAKMRIAIERLIDERWKGLYEAWGKRFEDRGLTKALFFELVKGAQAFEKFALVLRVRLGYPEADAEWKKVEQQSRDVYYAILGLAVIHRLADAEEWRAKHIRTLYMALKDEEKKYLLNKQAIVPTDDYRSIERKLYLALRMHSELEQRLALEAFLRAAPYRESKGDALVAEMKEARKGVNEILAAFQQRVESFIGDHKLLQPTAPPPTTKTPSRKWLDEDVERPLVLYFPEGRLQPDAACAPAALGEFLPQWAKTHLQGCGELDDLADGEMIIVLERGAPSRNIVPDPGNTLYTEVTPR